MVTADGEPTDAGARTVVERMLKDNATIAEKNVDAYCAATKDLVGEQEKRTRERDAALYMAGRSDWEGGKLGLLHLASSITQRMANPPAPGGAWALTCTPASTSRG